MHTSFREQVRDGGSPPEAVSQTGEQTRLRRAFGDALLVA
jgi:hypothetical protein